MAKDYFKIINSDHSWCLSFLHILEQIDQLATLLRVALFTPRCKAQISDPHRTNEIFYDISSLLIFSTIFFLNRNSAQIAIHLKDENDNE
jgi:hypothetical protein